MGRRVVRAPNTLDVHVGVHVLFPISPSAALPIRIQAAIVLLVLALTRAFHSCVVACQAVLGVERLVLGKARLRGSNTPLWRFLKLPLCGQ
jgi:hypothetical protein